jgi:ankyrin repeat protein
MAWHLKDESQIEELLKDGYDPNKQKLIGDTLLHRASKRRDPKVVQLLLKYGVDPNIQNKMGDTALHEASYR